MSFPDLGAPPQDPVELALYNFAGTSNWGDPKNSDWDRFYRFVIVAFKKDAGWDPDDVRKWLVNRKMPNDIAAKFSKIYEHALLTLKTVELVENDDYGIARVRGGTI